MTASGPTRPGRRRIVRALAGAALAAALVVPPNRRRFRFGAPASIAAAIAGPVSLAVLRPRTNGRDAALFALQMWGFLAVHEMPYDDPEALRRRLRIRYPIAIDRALGGGRLPTQRLQAALSRPRVTPLDRVLSVAHWAWFAEPHLALLYLQQRHPSRFARAAWQMGATYDLGAIGYAAIPTAPPWWASENGFLSDGVERRSRRVGAEAPPAVRRIMVDVGQGVWGPAWPRLYGSLGGNPWAAMPSLHFATSLLAAELLREADPRAGLIGHAYAATLGFALVYLGEHYVTDLIAGALLVAAIRATTPLATPLTRRLERALQRLERAANPPRGVRPASADG